MNLSIAEGVIGDQGNICERKSFQGKVSTPDVELHADEIVTSGLWVLTSVHRRAWGQGPVWATTKRRLVGVCCAFRLFQETQEGVGMWDPRGKAVN